MVVRYYTYQLSLTHLMINIYKTQLKHDTEKLIMCGQALSHCVNYTVRDIVDHWPKGEMNKLTVLEDASSSVPGFEAAGEQFLKDMKEAGLIIETTETCQP